MTEASSKRTARSRSRHPVEALADRAKISRAGAVTARKAWLIRVGELLGARGMIGSGLLVVHDEQVADATKALNAAWMLLQRREARTRHMDREIQDAVGGSLDPGQVILEDVAALRDARVVAILGVARVDAITAALQGLEPLSGRPLENR